MKKRILSAFLAFVFLLGTASLLPQDAFTDIPAFADSASGDFSYRICDDDTAAIMKYIVPFVTLPPSATACASVL